MVIAHVDSTRRSSRRDSGCISVGNIFDLFGGYLKQAGCKAPVHVSAAVLGSVMAIDSSEYELERRGSDLMRAVEQPTSSGLVRVISPEGTAIKTGMWPIRRSPDSRSPKPCNPAADQSAAISARVEQKRRSRCASRTEGISMREFVSMARLVEEKYVPSDCDSTYAAESEALAISSMRVLQPKLSEASTTASDLNLSSNVNQVDSAQKCDNFSGDAIAAPATLIAA
jgi:hypothetical protein